ILLHRQLERGPDGLLHEPQPVELPSSTSNHRAINGTGRSSELLAEQRQRVWLECWPPIVHRYGLGLRKGSHGQNHNGDTAIGHLRDLSGELLLDPYPLTQHNPRGDGFQTIALCLARRIIE